MTLRTITALAAIAVAGVAALPAHADTTISNETKAFAASSVGDTVAWSSYDPSAKTYRLMTLEDGKPVALPIAASKTPFDPDLGASRDGGKPVAVYTRHGDIYRFDFATGKERKLTALSTTAEERQPTYWRGAIAFVRLEHGKFVLRRGVTASGAKRTQVLASIPAKQGSIVDPQISFRNVAYTVDSTRDDKWGSEAVHVVLRSGEDRLVYEARSGGANDAHVTRPSFDPHGEHLYFARTNAGANAGNRYVRLNVARNKLTYARGTRLATSTSWLGEDRGLLVSLSDGQGICADGAAAPPACRLIQTGPLSFTAKP